MNVQFEWYKPLRGAIDTQDELIIFVLSMIIVAMAIDFLLGSLAARINPDIEFRSKDGINGIIRKLVSIVLLVFCIPLSILLPDGIALGSLQVLYLGYLGFELKSIFENLAKMGIDVELLKAFVSGIRGLGKGENKDGDNK
ncbi:phage holin family protein [Streptococcus danieliae]|nr:phage holin family protein [Streptococcus danieliae]